MPLPDFPLPPEQFIREPQKIARLRHPNIVRVYKVGEHNGRPFFTMDFVKGPSLDKRLGDFVRDPRAAAALMVKVARAVEHAHQQNIVHRDLKPGNILLDHDQEPLVTDFGLATEAVLPDCSGSDTVAGRDSASRSFQGIKGTISFMSPEQAAPPREVTRLSDVYGLGAVLYALLTGRPPYQDDQLLKLLEKVRDSECKPEPPRTQNPLVDHDLEAICLKCLEKDPARRYDRAEELAKDLERWLAGAETNARPWGRVEKLVRWFRRNPGLARLSAAAGIVLVAVVALLAMASDSSLRSVQRAGVLKIATDPTVPPMEFRNGATLTGFDIDLAQDLARRLGVQPEFKQYDWDWQDLIKRLDNRDFDMLLSTVVVNEARKQYVDFVPYLQMDHVFVCGPGTTVRNVDDLAGKVVAVQKDTRAHEMVDKLKTKRDIAIKKIIALGRGSDPFDALLKGEAEVTLVEKMVARHYAKGHKEHLRETGTVSPAMDPDAIGIAFRKGDKKLQAAVSEAIKAMEEDGTFARLEEQWFQR
jgi:ABC-type amino acid transport substrate-binding protein